MHTHKVHILSSPDEPDEVIAYVPRLQRAYLIPRESASDIPATVESDEDLSVQQPDVSDSMFDRSTIVLTLRCNLRCVYCYEDAQTPHVPGKVMDWRVVQAAIDRVIQNTAAKPVRDDRVCTVNFFGGEPTVAWKTLIRALTYARQESERHQVRLRTTINTNGRFGPAKLQRILPLIDVFTVSLDGPRDLHDGLRPTATGGGSFTSAFATAQTIFRADVAKLVLRTTISRETLEHMPRIAQFFTDRFPGVVQAYEPLQETGRALATKSHAPVMEDFLEQVRRITGVVEAAKGAVKISMLDLGNSGPSFCGVNGRNFVVTPEGLVTACNRKMSPHDTHASRFIFGAYERQSGTFRFDGIRLEALQRYTVNSIEDCRECFARYACRGGCVAIKADRNPLFWTVKHGYCAAIQEHMIKMLFRSLRREPVRQ